MTRYRPARLGLLAVCVSLAASVPCLALDPPHASIRSIDCASCHITHNAPGGTITTIAGNANLCLSCHTPGGQASAKPLAPADQALPGPGLPAGQSPSGTSHRWDSGPGGHVRANGANTSTGTVQSGGAFVGRYAKTYTITITTAGNTGAARFGWTATTPGGGSGANVVTGSSVPLDEGVTVTFTDGGGAPSFVLNDQWDVHVRTDIDPPSDPAMAVRMEGEKIMCSTCHDQHSQKHAPFDPAAPAFGGPGTGEGRHFQRIANDAGQMCADCHRARHVTSSSQGSHPVGVGLPGGEYQSPLALPLDSANEVQCSSCHDPHYTPTTDGSLLRMTSVTSLCSDCHTLADTATPASHADPSDPSTLWPGGQYGTTFPAVTDPALQGSCTNCHQAHGWPDTAAPAQDYATLLVEHEEDFCSTCHDSNGPAVADIRTQIAKASNHPLGLASGVHSPAEPGVVDSPNRHVECQDCHNPHQAKPRVSLPGPATVPRPASGPLAEVRGVSASGTDVDPAAYEYQTCFRCHGDSTGKPAGSTNRQFPETNVRLEFNGSYPSYHPVASTGTNPDVPSLIGGWSTSSIMACTDCHNNESGPAVGGAEPNGPHGSTWPTLLERRYVTADPSPFDPAKYALCFKCHDWQNSIRRDESFSEHKKHIDGEDVSCNVCHDPHASSDNSKLINFDLNVVEPFNGKIEFKSTGQFEGECTLSCHGEDHDPFDYKP